MTLTPKDITTLCYLADAIVSEPKQFDQFLTMVRDRGSPSEGLEKSLELLQSEFAASPTRSSFRQKSGEFLNSPDFVVRSVGKAIHASLANRSFHRAIRPSIRPSWPDT